MFINMRLGLYTYMTELVLGRVVGRGGFSVVNEVREINLQEVFDTSNEEAKRRAEIGADCCSKETGSHRYVVKMLRTDLPEDEHTKGVVDLAVEARFLAKLSHPNIITMRATAASDPLESKFFVVLDRLVSTLEHKMHSWRKEIGAAMGFWFGPCIGHCCANKQVLHRLWIDRLLVARDCAAAIRYLHDQDIVYRDLKPDNVGFSEDGDVKIFDFGLAKRLHPDDRLDTGLYTLTGNTGSLRYMAPEVALGRPYDERVDAYSFGILFWQICALTTPYSGYSCKMHADLVVGKGYRPKPDSSWPLPWTDLMKRCWSTDVFARPDFENIVQVMDEEIEEMLREDGMEQEGRAGHIHAKKTKAHRIKAQKDGERLDVDTRIHVSGFVPENGPQKRHDADIV
mmetsp:Transcript_46494/g.140870  ORF Transcript_46494/g.140870 Transcript_46494/m.140870 type:complete len:398 (+) Transcript_46494:410-1603(+)